jgi:N6-adenosine-specific RNA methylase IME4
MQPLLRGRYRTIFVDPPWPTEQRGSAYHHYTLMPLARIKALPVQALAADDAHVWLWTTNATLRIGYDVMESWGFVPRSLLTWIKPTMGLGPYLRSASEYLLFGTRGRAPVKFRGQPNWLFAPRQAHSHKPEELYGVIERVSDGPYLELFARRRQQRWHVWGNEIDSDIVVPGFPVPSDHPRRVSEGESA